METKRSNSPNSIIVIQSGIFGAIQARQYFGAEDRKRDEGYMFFPLLNGEAMAQVVPGMQQIVFTSHNPPQIDARHIALEIKEKNPMALVFAFTIRSIEGGNCGQLDGIINKASNLVSQRLDSFLRTFLGGRVSRQELIALAHEI